LRPFSTYQASSVEACCQFIDPISERDPPAISQPGRNRCYTHYLSAHVAKSLHMIIFGNLHDLGVYFLKLVL
jgi:hypothetical protein